VPLLIDLARGDAKNLAVATFVSKALTFSRSVIASPDVPAERVEILRKGLAAVVKDPKLLAEVEKLRLDIGFAPGAEAEGLIRDVLATPKQVVDAAQAAMKLK
jgi:tripartite-type tricarboxylate transporter receptor subunit TctC